MSITVLSNIVMPETLVQAGFSGRQIRSLTRVFNQGGFAQINSNWELPLREFELGYIPRAPEVWQTIEGLWEATLGGTFGFLMLDPKDSRASLSQGALVPFQNGQPVGISGFGYGVPTYRTYKRYAPYGGAAVYERYISRPKSPLTALQRAGVQVVSGAGAGQATLSGGTVTFGADLTLMVTEVVTGASTQITLIGDIGIPIGGRLWLQSMTGTGAGLLNNLSHAVSDVVGNTLTLNTNTTGAAINVSGNGLRYPQPTQSLAWSGDFYVPVHFANDDLSWLIERSGAYEKRLISGQSVVLREVRE